MKAYKIITQLGSGSFGAVYKVQKKSNKKFYALKKFRSYSVNGVDTTVAKAEAKILSDLDSKYIVKYYDSFQEEGDFNIIMEYCDNGDLEKWLKTEMWKGKLLSESFIWKIFIQICIGLAYLHKKNILHRDLKPWNVFLMNNLDIKIGDWGLSKVWNNNSLANTYVGTPYYISPEIYQDIPYNSKSDVWAWGCVLYELCTYNRPFNARSSVALVLKVWNENYKPIHSDYSGHMKKILAGCWEKNDKKRYEVKDILNKSFILKKAQEFGIIRDIFAIFPEWNPRKLTELITRNISPVQDKSTLSISPLLKVESSKKYVIKNIKLRHPDEVKTEKKKSNDDVVRNNKQLGKMIELNSKKEEFDKNLIYKNSNKNIFQTEGNRPEFRKPTKIVLNTSKETAKQIKKIKIINKKSELQTIQEANCQNNVETGVNINYSKHNIFIAPNGDDNDDRKEYYKTPQGKDKNNLDTQSIIPNFRNFKIKADKKSNITIETPYRKSSDISVIPLQNKMIKSDEVINPKEIIIPSNKECQRQGVVKYPQVKFVIENYDDKFIDALDTMDPTPFPGSEVHDNDIKYITSSESDGESPKKDKKHPIPEEYKSQRIDCLSTRIIKAKQEWLETLGETQGKTIMNKITELDFYQSNNSEIIINEIEEMFKTDFPHKEGKLMELFFQVVSSEIQKEHWKNIN